MFSRRLTEAIQERMKRGEQIVLLLNRRGFATFIMCRDCGHVEECPNCDIALTYHKSVHFLKCHYCSHGDRKSTRLNSSHVAISYAVFCLKKTENLQHASA